MFFRGKTAVVGVLGWRPTHAAVERERDLFSYKFDVFSALPKPVSTIRIFKFRTKRSDLFSSNRK